MSRLLTTREVADRLGLSSATVLRRWRAGELPGYRLGSNVLRFDEGDIESWLGSTYCNASHQALGSEDSLGTSERDALGADLIFPGVGQRPRHRRA